MIYVLLTDSDDTTVLVACADQNTADEVGSSAIFADGDVSAYIVPDWALTNTNEVIDRLRKSQNCTDLADLEGDAWSKREGA